MKLTLRDLFWLALFIASLTVWAIEHRKGEREIAAWRPNSWFMRSDRVAKPSEAERKRLAAAQKFARFTNEQLDEHFASLAAAVQYYHVVEYEPCIAEMARRGMSAQLQKHYDALLAQHQAATQFPYNSFNNCELLTALRRSQNQPDPLRIDVTLSNPLSRAEGIKAPLVHVKVTNVDSGKASINRVVSGAYLIRNGRWRVVLTDEHGQPVADSNCLRPMGGGGLHQLTILGYGVTEGGSNELDLRRYVAPPRSGKYQLQVLYHNERSIAGEQDLTGLIVSKSDPIWITVHNLDEAEARQWPMRPHPALAILAACGLLIVTSFIRPASPSQAESNADAKPTASSPLKIARRDVCWTALVVAVALGFWLDHRSQERRIERSYEDAKARWTITLADFRQGPS